jgi:hypothetical protein
LVLFLPTNQKNQNGNSPALPHPSYFTASSKL